MREYLSTLAAVLAVAVAVWAAAALAFCATGQRPVAPHHVSCSEGGAHA
mgnify:CR=1 FL=1